MIHKEFNKILSIRQMIKTKMCLCQIPLKIWLNIQVFSVQMKPMDKSYLMKAKTYRNYCNNLEKQTSASHKLRNTNKM